MDENNKNVPEPLPPMSGEEKHELNKKVWKALGLIALIYLVIIAASFFAGSIFGANVQMVLIYVTPMVIAGGALLIRRFMKKER